MKKRIFGAAVAATVAAVALASCGGAAATTTGAETPTTSGATPTSEATNKEGDLVRILCWNDEFRSFFNRYVTDEGKALLAKNELMESEVAKSTKEGYHVDGVAVTFEETPSADGAYQQALDFALGNQKNNKQVVDMFLAEADYITKYADSDWTAEVASTVDQSKIYAYTAQAASDAKGKVKGVSFQCCPSGMIYNRVVAKAVLGTDDPVEVQKAVADWSKFDETAAKCKTAGYYMTACTDETFRVFSNNAKTPWVDADLKLTIPAEVMAWAEQADKYATAGYTVVAGVWDGAKTDNTKADANKALACFGPAWYYNFCMGDSKKGDWALCKGPQAHFWGGTWLMQATGTDNPTIVAKVMNAFTADETVLEGLVENEGQFTNNSAFNQKKADAGRKNAFLGDQNDTAIFCGMAGDIKWENHTIYDQLCNEGFTGKYAEYLNGKVTKEKAIENFKTYIAETYAELTVK